MNIFIKSFLCLLVASVCTIEARRIDRFDLGKFLKRVIDTNFKKDKIPSIGSISTGCTDNYQWCSEYETYCSHNVVLRYCKKTCGKCPTTTTTTTTTIQPPPACEDKASNCGGIKSFCTNANYETYMSKYCAATCGKCKTEDLLQCGIAKQRGQNRTTTIVGGVSADKGYYPWQAAIYYGDEFLCGGSLIGNKHILTAAHCFKGLSKDLSLYKVVLGEHNRDDFEGTEETRLVKRVVQHESYKYETESNDVAFMELDEELIFGDNINRACLPEDDEELAVGTKCFVSGWGKIRIDGDSVPLLQHVALPIANRKHCEERNRFNQHVVNDRMICAGYHDGTNYASGCHGDSGGPLVCEQPNGSWKLFGIVSWGSPQCNGLDRYTVFSRVSKYTRWVKGQIN